MPLSTADDGPLARLLFAFGLPAGASAVYVTLLTERPLTEARLRALSPEFRVALKLLTSMRLVNIDQDRKDRPVIYATDPEIGWLALSADIAWLNSNSLAPIRPTTPTGALSADQMRQLCANIATSAAVLHRPHRISASHLWHPANSDVEMTHLIAEVILKATRRIIATSRAPRLEHLATIWAALTTRIADGVAYHRIAEVDEVKEHGLAIVSRDTNELAIDLRLVPARRIRTKFYIADDSLMAVYHIGTRMPGIRFGAITRHRHIIERHVARFWKLHAGALPAAPVIKMLRADAESLLTRARDLVPPDHCTWLASMVDYGKFSVYPVEQGWHPRKTQVTLARLTRAGLVRSDSGFHLPAYSISETDLFPALPAT